MRVLFDTPRSGVENMEADRRLLDAAVRENDVLLRLYSWTPSCITLGWMQKPEETLALDVMARDGVTWVHRPTGGRAVLHEQDLTYCVAFPAGFARMGSSIAQSYRVIADCLIDGFSRAGIVCSAHDSKLDSALVRREGKLPCFLAPNRDEIMSGGRKLVGSAQRRTAEGVVQHGSIPMTPAFRRLPEYLALSMEQRESYRRLLERKCTCAAELRPGLETTELARCIAEAFAASIA